MSKFCVWREEYGLALICIVLTLMSEFAVCSLLDGGKLDRTVWTSNFSNLIRMKEYHGLLRIPYSSEYAESSFGSGTARFSKDHDSISI
ncbi:hypothetical protein PoB_000228400 [Plakobranchus ocellatus]|uniref:Uncharacterized protein n=1 Tax=Plakobranchus ocellatus TaxID=259542 RepID=A0AAV3XY53_9GAST|nr:hypothetical protein PoB_000228400 [Plakobranchus ocellatus]